MSSRRATPSLVAKAIPFKNNNSDIISKNLQGAVQELADRHFGKLYAAASQDPNVTSTGTNVEAVTTIGVDVVEAGTFSFRAQWSFRQKNSKNNTNGKARVYWRSDQNTGGTLLDANTTSGKGGNFLGDGNGEQTVGFGTFTATGPQTNIQLYAKIKRIAGSGAARINSIRLELWRIS